MRMGWPSGPPDQAKEPNMTTIATIKSEIASLQVQARAHRNSHNEGSYGYNPYDSKIEDACKRLRAAELADYVARWDDIRAAWNAAVAKYARNGKVDMRDLPKIEAEAGISNGDRMAVKAMVG
jgi:hypothetical protein